MSRDDALHRFFFMGPLIAARHKECGKLVAVYEGHTADDHPDCAVTDGWLPAGRCRCDPPLPAGAELAALIDRARVSKRVFLYRAPIKIYI